MPLIGAYLQTWPEVRADIEFSDRPADLVEEGFDLAIRIGGQGAPDGFVSRVIAEYPVWFCASPAYLERRGRPLHAEALPGHDCILFRSRTRTQEWFGKTGDDDAARLLAHGRLRMNSAEAIREAVLAGLGIALLPSFLIDEDIASARVTRLFPELATQTVRILCLYPSKRLLDPRVRTFIDHLGTALSRVGSEAPRPRNR
jgi:DNA-binding transcriptional LysR family regulator